MLAVGLMVTEKKNLLFSFSHFKSMGAIYGHGGHFDLRTVTICTNFQSDFNTKLHMKFEEVWPRGVLSMLFKDVSADRQTYGQTDGRRTTDGA